MFNNGVAQCATVSAYSSGGCPGTQRTRITALHGFQSNGSWLTQATVWDGVNNDQYAPDIAISPDGDEAFVAAVAQSGRNLAVVWHVDLVTGALVIRSLGYSASHPLRVSWDQDFNGAVVIGADQSTGTFQSSRWRLHRVLFDAATGTIPPPTQMNFDYLDDFDSEGGRRAIAADFDFDCATSLLNPDQCVLVALINEDLGPGFVDTDPGTLFSHNFRVPAAGIDVDLEQGNWVTSNPELAQAITGVAVTSRTVVAMGLRNNVSASKNSRTIEYDNYSVAPSDILTSFNHKSDIQTCSTGSSGGHTMAASTPHGGVAISWCPICDTGRLISIQQGNREDGDAFCY
ncbi:MAG: hypothetical protein A2138_05960 [Deltaproteobacteria bacterium RBG_16_71_12]|nr:MAG: hypothetical protein A2138_05960 [Deltaproteobacteria bacterium RBG_16_71_12]